MPDCTVHQQLMWQCAVNTVLSRQQVCITIAMQLQLSPARSAANESQATSTRSVSCNRRLFPSTATNSPTREHSEGWRQYALLQQVTAAGQTVHQGILQSHAETHNISSLAKSCGDSPAQNEEYSNCSRKQAPATRLSVSPIVQSQT